LLIYAIDVATVITTELSANYIWHRLRDTSSYRKRVLWHFISMSYRREGNVDCRI